MVNSGCRAARWSPARLVLQWSLQLSVAGGVLQQSVAVDAGSGVL